MIGDSRALRLALALLAAVIILSLVFTAVRFPV